MALFDNIKACTDPMGMILDGERYYVNNCRDWMKDNIKREDENYRGSRLYDNDGWMIAGIGRKYVFDPQDPGNYIYYIRSDDDRTYIKCKIIITTSVGWVSDLAAIIQWRIKITDRVIEEICRVDRVNSAHEVATHPRVNIELKSISGCNRYVAGMDGVEIRSESGNNFIIKSHLVMNSWDERTGNIMNGWWDFESDREMNYTIPEIILDSHRAMDPNNCQCIVPYRERVINAGYIM